MLDYNTLLIALGFSGACLFLMLIANWLAARAEQLMLGWSIAVAMIVVNVIAYSRYVLHPMPALAMIVFSSLIVALSLLWAMARQFLTRRRQWMFALKVWVVASIPFIAAMICGASAAAFVFFNLSAAALLMATAREYWLARQEAPLPISCLSILYAAIGASFVPCAVMIADQGRLVLDAAPHNWAETLNIIVSLAGMSGIGALSLALNQSAMAKRHRLDSLSDGLTGLPNRRALFERFGGGIRPFTTLILFDLDRFKSVNDDYGHAIGDEVLRRFAEAVSEEIRQDDFAARLGGEEFVIVLPRSRRERAFAVAERVRARFSRQVVQTETGALRCTVSAGIAVAEQAEQTTLDALLGSADKELYAAKNAGRNQVGAERYRLAG